MSEYLFGREIREGEGSEDKIIGDFDKWFHGLTDQPISEAEIAAMRRACRTSMRVLGPWPEEGDRAILEFARCVLPNGHEGDHQTPDGYWWRFATEDSPGIVSNSPLPIDSYESAFTLPPIEHFIDRAITEVYERGDS